MNEKDHVGYREGGKNVLRERPEAKSALFGTLLWGRQTVSSNQANVLLHQQARATHACTQHDLQIFFRLGFLACASRMRSHHLVRTNARMQASVCATARRA